MPQDRIVDGAGHDIEEDRPDAVISALREVVDAARETGGGTASKP